VAKGGDESETGGIVVGAKPVTGGPTVPLAVASTPPWERLLNDVIVAKAGDEEPHAAPLDAPKLKEYQEYTTAFGLYCCSCLFGKRWQLRDAALRAIISPEGWKQLTNGVRPQGQGSPTVVLQSLLNYLDGRTTGVNDSISQVFFTVCDALKAIVSEELAGAPIVAAVGGLTNLLPALLLKAGDSNQRVREKAQTTLLMLALSNVGSERVVNAALHDPQEKNKKPLNYRVHSARLSLVRVLLAKVGLNRKEHKTGLTAEAITQRLCVPLLTHASSEVRDAAVQLIVTLHDHVPASVMAKHLSEVKPAQMAVIDEQLAQKDGGGGNDGGRAKEKELASSSINVEKGGNHPVLEAARQAAGKPAAESKPQQQPQQSTAARQQQQQQQKEREAAERAEKTCQFCGKYDSKYTDDILDAHYARVCPWLVPCPLCQQITEIPTLQQHLIGECNRATAVKQCPTCREAVPVDEFEDHVTAQACIPHSNQYFVCPLCHAKLSPTDDGWDDHLLKAPGCPNNPRRYDGGSGEEFR
jgi:centrosomal protein CEP104